MDNQFSVVQYFEDGSYEYVRRYVSAENAMNAVQHYTNNVAVMLGITNRVIVTDGGDSICFEWIRGKGVVFPAKEEITENERT
jgi:hypothetical protein